MTLQTIKKKVLQIFKNEGVLKAAVFGSYARGEGKKNSDVDFLVKLPSSKSLIDLVGLKLELESRLGKKVDVLTYNSINPLLKRTILNEQKIIYEKGSKNFS